MFFIDTIVGGFVIAFLKFIILIVGPFAIRCLVRILFSSCFFICFYLVQWCSGCHGT